MKKNINRLAVLTRMRRIVYKKFEIFYSEKDMERVMLASGYIQCLDLMLKRIRTEKDMDIGMLNGFALANKKIHMFIGFCIGCGLCTIVITIIYIILSLLYLLY